MITSPALPVRADSARGEWFQHVLGLASSPVNPVPPALAKAVAAYRESQAKYASLEAQYRRLAPGYDACPHYSPEAAKLRKLEDRLSSLLDAQEKSSRGVIAALDLAGLNGAILGQDLFAVTHIEPEGRRRLVVLPVSGIAFSGN